MKLLKIAFVVGLSALAGCATDQGKYTTTKAVVPGTKADTIAHKAVLLDKDGKPVVLKDTPNGYVVRDGKVVHSAPVAVTGNVGHGKQKLYTAKDHNGVKYRTSHIVRNTNGKVVNAKMVDRNYTTIKDTTAPKVRKDAYGRPVSIAAANREQVAYTYDPTAPYNTGETGVVATSEVTSKTPVASSYRVIEKQNVGKAADTATSLRVDYTQPVVSQRTTTVEQTTTVVAPKNDPNINGQYRGDLTIQSAKVVGHHSRNSFKVAHSKYAHLKSGYDVFLQNNVVHFPFDSTALLPNERLAIKNQIVWLKNHNFDKITVAGHTDIRGSRAYNFALGARRAAAVKRMLVRGGISASKIKVVSYGKDRPIDAHNYSRNRRAVTTVK